MLSGKMDIHLADYIVTVCCHEIFSDAEQQNPEFSFSGLYEPHQEKTCLRDL